MSVKYYTHFIAQSEGAVEYNEYRGVVELLDQSSRVEGDRDIARMLAVGPSALRSATLIP